MSRDESDRSLLLGGANKELGDPKSSYGKEWWQFARLTAEFEQTLKTSSKETPKEDLAICEAVLHLLKVYVQKDRLGWVLRDINALVEKSAKNKVPGLLENELVLIQTAYGLSLDEWTEVLRKREFSSLGIGVSIPQPLFHPEWPDKGAIEGRLSKFSELRISNWEGGVQINMRPVYDGGIDDLAYPLHQLRITVKHQARLEMNFENEILFWRRNELDEEIGRHPEIVRALKLHFAQIVRMYSSGREAFLRDREDDGEKTTLAKSVFECIDDYLEKRLDRKTHQAFEKALRFIQSENFESVVELRVLNEQLVDENSHARKRGSWYSENRRTELGELVAKTAEKLEGLGAVIEAGQIVNLRDMALRIMQDGKFARRVNAVWDDLVKLAGKKVFPLDMDCLKRWKDIYRGDYYKDVYQRALELSRGMITIQVGQQYEAQDFLV